jgi:hypothetical protein
MEKKIGTLREEMRGTVVRGIEGVEKERVLSRIMIRMVEKLGLIEKSGRG